MTEGYGNGPLRSQNVVFTTRTRRMVLLQEDRKVKRKRDTARCVVWAVLQISAGRVLLHSANQCRLPDVLAL